jgi:hypothetical protein
MRIIYASKGMPKKFGVRVIYQKIRYFVVSVLPVATLFKSQHSKEGR